MRRPSTAWTFALTSIALFMVTLDNLVVTMVLPVIRRDLGSSLQDLQWTVNAYTLTFAVLLLTGASLGDRFGRRLVFAIGVLIFTVGSAMAALAPSSEWLIAARACQESGGAFVMPLTLTLLSAAVSPQRRALALGAWGGVGGIGIAVGPLVGGAVAQGLNWHWVFWINVPIGLLTAALAFSRLQESRGPQGRLDLAGLGLVSAGLLGLVWGVIHGSELGWTDPQIAVAFALGLLFIALFVIWETRAPSPMLPLGMFRSRAFVAANVASILMSFGMFGSIFLLSQFFQVVQGYDPLEAGIRVLPWTAMPALVAPFAGILGGRIGTRPVLVPGLALMAAGLAWNAAFISPGLRYDVQVVGFIIAGIGMGLFFAPIANAVLSAVRPGEEGKASGANNTLRQLGVVFGVAVLGSIFAANGSYRTPQAFVDGLQPAVWIGAAVVALGALAALALPARHGARVRDRREASSAHLAEGPATITTSTTV